MSKPKPNSPYRGAGPMHSALPESVVLMERVRQALIAAGMHPERTVADQSFAQVIDCCVRNGVDLGDLPPLCTAPLREPGE